MRRDTHFALLTTWRRSAERPVLRASVVGENIKHSIDEVARENSVGFVRKVFGGRNQERSH